MKLYTEEQVFKVIVLARLHEFSHSQEELCALVTSIELPTEKEIKEMRRSYIEHVNTMVHADLERDGYLDVGFSSGAKWMRDKIQGGNI